MDYLGGAIGKLSPAPNQWTYTALYSFCHNRPLCGDGIQPNAPLAWDDAGNLYGTTLNGGIYPYPNPCPDQQGCGVAFQMRPGRTEPGATGFCTGSAPLLATPSDLTADGG